MESSPFNYKLYSVVLIANLGGAISQILLQSYSRIIWDESSNIETGYPLHVLGIIMGSFISSCICRMYGRKPALIFEGFTSIIASTLLMFDKNSWDIYTGFLFYGLTTGSFFTVNTMYFAEVAENWNRGILGTTMILNMNLGSLFHLVISQFVTEKIIIIVTIVISNLYLISIFMIVPESPYYLGKKNINEAENSLRKLRINCDVKDELIEIEEYVTSTRKLSLTEILSKKWLLEGICVGCLLNIFQNSTNLVVKFYIAEFDYFLDCANKPIYVGSGFIFASFVMFYMLEAYGRRVLIIISYCGLIIFLFFLGIFYDDEINVKFIEFLLICYNIFLTFGVTSISWVIIGELFPMESKEIALFITNTISVILGYIFNQYFNDILNIFGLSIILYEFAGFALLAAIFCKIFLTETKGLSLKEIQSS